MNRKLESLLDDSNIALDAVLTSPYEHIHAVLKQTENEILLLALSNSSEYARQRVFEVLSDQGKKFLAEDLGKMGPVSAEEQLAAQGRIIELFNAIPGSVAGNRKLH